MSKAQEFSSLDRLGTALLLYRNRSTNGTGKCCKGSGECRGSDGGDASGRT